MGEEPGEVISGLLTINLNLTIKQDNYTQTKYIYIFELVLPNHGVVQVKLGS